MIEAPVAERTSASKGLERALERAGQRPMVLGIVSLGTGIPITAIAGGITGLPGVVAAWDGIAVLNVAHALSSRRR